MQHSDEQRQAFGARLAAARERAGLTGEAVGRALDYKAGKKTVSQWETGRGVPDSLTLRQLCRLYDCTADSLLWGSADEIPQASRAIPADLTRRVAALDPSKREGVLRSFAATLDLVEPLSGKRAA